jgi:multidrug efflux pump subunit AcrA (membrane-fusion protein)
MARLTPFHILPALIAAVSHAGEVTIEPRPFSVEKSFNTTALPAGDCVLLKLDPKAWTDFKIIQLTSHGSKVAKGDALVRFDSEAIDKKLEDSRRALEAGSLALAQAEQDSKTLQETAANKLEALRRTAGIAKEENTYFTQVRRKAVEDSAAQALKRSNQILSNQREELKQLSRMYEADDITENTEEIILVRQQDAVAAAEFAQRMESLDHKRTLEVTLPREAKALADTERDTAIALKKAETDIPRSIELNKLELESLTTSNQRAKQALAELEADRTRFEFKAPADGWFYHGPIENGRWTTAGKILETLVLHGHPPAHAAFATFVPGTTKLALVSFLDEATARSLKPELTGAATLPGREDVEIPVKLLKLAATPCPDGTYRADFSATWPKEPVPAAGATAQVRMISYQQAAAIVIPTKALNFAADGWTVEVKLADGKTERRHVKRGRVSKDDTEILSGLEAGQVVVVP